MLRLSVCLYKQVHCEHCDASSSTDLPIHTEHGLMTLESEVRAAETALITLDLVAENSVGKEGGEPALLLAQVSPS